MRWHGLERVRAMNRANFTVVNQNAIFRAISVDNVVVDKALCLIAPKLPLLIEAE